MEWYKINAVFMPANAASMDQGVGLTSKHFLFKNTFCKPIADIDSVSFL
jgi:predicted membrane protein